MGRREAIDIDMREVARRVLLENGFRPDVPQALDDTVTRDELAAARDMRDMPWSSVDNDTSRDLDQLEVAERLDDGSIRMYVAIADVDAFVAKGSPIDEYAWTNTLSLYTGVQTFPMLPRVLSEGESSLLEGQDRLAVVTEMVVRPDGTLDDKATKIYSARVQNKAKLVYEDIGAWLEGNGSAPRDPQIAEQVQLHDEAAQRLRERRFEHGALELETIEARPVAEGGRIVDLELQHKSRARELVEDLMIAVNGATARYLEQRGYSSIRRVVHAPKRWERIVALAAESGTQLPAEPDRRALASFASARRKADPVRFADLSLSIVKLLGPGEYRLQRATDPDTGHFGLAVDDYAHSTAPNRRYPDLITQRLLKAAAAGERAPYSDDELLALATHCTERENAARKVERTMRKVAAAVLLSSRIGDTFDAIVTGVTPKGTFARLFKPPAEGLVVKGKEGLDVGDLVTVKLVDTEPTRGFIDLVAVSRGRRS
ncbi:MAG: RNB domain-containing ribonuclease [Deltaproteobacteria bacterium]|nr:RNB domain-containing ribonuclease [Deltaproteobacteria bacterium]MDQ3301231.1 RNB domain-containing ribonuclease [Myxococcota bacterium]